MKNTNHEYCRFDTESFGIFYQVDPSVLSDEDGYNLSHVKNMRVDLSKLSSDLTISDFNHMKIGVHYKLIATNGAETKNHVIFPAKTTLYSGNIVAVNGMTVVYDFFTDGYSIYCERAIYA